MATFDQYLTIYIRQAIYDDIAKPENGELREEVKRNPDFIKNTIEGTKQDIAECIFDWYKKQPNPQHSPPA